MAFILASPFSWTRVPRGKREYSGSLSPHLPSTGGGKAISRMRFQGGGSLVTRGCVPLNDSGGSQYVGNKLIGYGTNIDKAVICKHLARISPRPRLSLSLSPLCFLSRRWRITYTLIRLHLRSALIYLCLTFVPGFSRYSSSSFFYIIGNFELLFSYVLHNLQLSMVAPYLPSCLLLISYFSFDSTSFIFRLSSPFTSQFFTSCDSVIAIL